MILPPSFSRKMAEIETVEAEKMGWLDLPRGTSCPTFPYIECHTGIKYQNTYTTQCMHQIWVIVHFLMYIGVKLNPRLTGGSV